MNTLFVNPVQRLYQVLSFSTEVVPSFFVYGQSLSKFLSSAQRLYQSSISLNLTGSVTSVWVWSAGRGPVMGGVSVYSGKHQVIVLSPC